MLDTTRAVMRTDPCRIALLLELSGAQEQVHCPDHLGSKLSLSFNNASYILLNVNYFLFKCEKCWRGSREPGRREYVIAANQSLSICILYVSLQINCILDCEN